MLCSYLLVLLAEYLAGLGSGYGTRGRARSRIWLRHYHSHQTSDDSRDKESAAPDERGQNVGAREYITRQDCEETGAGCGGHEHRTQYNHHYSENENIRSQSFSKSRGSISFPANR